MVGFFQEKEGVNSAMRLNSSLAVYIGLGIAVFSVVGAAFGLTIDVAQNLTYSLSLIGGGFGFKTMQKYGEK